ncbi:hypothetical protein U9M48_011300 [Paspalum notatum var. saurae]|uniref:Uncharacterized protein n=1 Tax=Paspalum notatum var. saurae TaxID=547442 RepID=A0AAQ3SVY3_PASNO
MVGAGGRHGRKAAHLPAWVQCDPGPRGCGVATTAEGQIYPSPVPAPSSSSPSATQRSGATPRQWTDFGCRLNLTLETNFETYQVLVGAAGRAAKGQHNQVIVGLARLG